MYWVSLMNLVAMTALLLLQNLIVALAAESRAELCTPQGWLSDIALPMLTVVSLLSLRAVNVIVSTCVALLIPACGYFGG